MSLTPPETVSLGGPGLLDRLGSGIATGLQGALSTFMEEQKERKHGKIFGEEFEKLPQSPSPQEYQGALSKIIERGVPLEKAIKLGDLHAALKKSEPKTPFGGKTQDELSTLFQKLGMDEEMAKTNAELFQTLPVGGQTEYARMLIDRIQRGQLEGSGGIKTKEIPPTGQPSPEKETFEWPSMDPYENMTPKEKIATQKELRKENTDIYKDVKNRIKGAEKAGFSIKQLTKLNESGKLPEKLQKWNVNWGTGDLRFPALANKETQLYAKTINEFIKGAKEAFGARVTNFELDRFMAQLPTLANSPEGRRAILLQMNYMNNLQNLYDEGLKQVYDKYGATGIDPVEAEKLAEKVIANKKDELISKMNGVVEEADEISENKSLLEAEQKGFKRVSPGTKLSEEKATEIYKKANGNKKTAEKIARHLGYEF